ncbi:SUMO-activating enzyme subunit 2, partial [Nosema granulosis]
KTLYLFYPTNYKMKRRILVVGCGGIGCELIKLLAKGEQNHLILIDFDTIELSNLNRQFLFLDEDIGKFKAEMICKKIKNLIPSCEYLVDNIKNYDLNFFKELDIVYNCLDNNESRGHVNLMCFLSKTKLIDGGSGGYKGQACYFDYSMECFDCLPKPVNKKYHVCTVRGFPTKFEHCVEFVKTVIFEELGDPFKTKCAKKYYKKTLKEILEVNPLEDNNCKDIKKIYRLIKKLIKKQNPKKGYKLEYNKDDYSVNELMYKLSSIRAKSAGIEIMSFFEAQTVANNIISSICTTNAMIASLMLLSEQKQMNYFLGIGRKSILKIQPDNKRKDCPTCSIPWLVMNFKKNFTVIDLFEFIKPFYNCKYLLDSEMAYFSFLPYNLNEKPALIKNTIATVGCSGDKILKIYFLEEKENFEIVNRI